MATQERPCGGRHTWELRCFAGLHCTQAACTHRAPVGHSEFACQSGGMSGSGPAHALSQGCGLWWCFSSCLTGQHSCELRLSFHLWLSFHLSPDSGDQQGLPSSSHRLLVQNRTVGTQTLRLPCCSCAMLAKSCTCILLQLGHRCWILNKTDSDRLQLRCKQMAEGFEPS